MKISFLILFIGFLGACMPYQLKSKSAELFFYDKNNKSELLGRVYFENKKIIFIESKINVKNELIKKAIKNIKYEFDQINKYGHLETNVQGEIEYSDDGKTIISKGGYNTQYVYFNEQEKSWEGFITYLRITYGYQIKIV